MGGTTRRLNEADASFLAMQAATGMPYAPIPVAVYERAWDDPSTVLHLHELMARLLPGMRQRITRDRFSLALPRWADVPGFDVGDNLQVLPAPGDGTLRAVLDWAQDWSRLPVSDDLPPWRATFFEDVTVDGVPGRTVGVSRVHHALTDGQGAAAMAQHYYQWNPDEGLPALPPPLPREQVAPWPAWKDGWAQEGHKVGALVRNTAGRVRRAAASPSAGAARAKELAQAMGRLATQQGATQGHSPLLRRTSDRNRFDRLSIDFRSLRAGARASGGRANDGLMAAVSLALHRYHLDHGVKVADLRLAMPISTRTDNSFTGNELIGAIMELPLLDDAAAAVKECAALSRRYQDDTDMLWLSDRFRALGNRMPTPIFRRMITSALDSVDVSLSNVNGVPLRHWVAGVEVIDTIPFLVGGPAVVVVLVSLAEHASIGIISCPEAIPDPAHLVERLREAFADVSALAV